MLELEEARERILATIRTLPAENIAVADAVGRIVSAAVRALVDLPGFDNSAMDGYAVRADDLTNAHADHPVALRVTGEMAAGGVPLAEVRPGHCVRIFTGAALPQGADSVVMQEDVRANPEDPKQILCSESIKPWENVRLRGEDVKRGQEVLSEGENINPAGAGLLAAVGLKEIRVSRQPSIGLLSTGSELIEAGEALPPGKIYESNRITLAALLKQAGANARVYGLVPDSFAATQAALEKALTECDGVVTSGGVSVGEHDFVKNAFERMGGTTNFWKVSIKPGKPFLFGRWGEKSLFGLPGNPVSALVTFLLLVRPALLKWQGAANTDLLSGLATLAEPLVNQAERRHFMRVRVDAEGKVRITGLQGSHVLTSLAKANGLVDVPPRSRLECGAVVRVWHWGN